MRLTVKLLVIGVLRWALLGQRVVVLTLFGPDKEIKRFTPAWDLVRTTFKIEDPQPAASPAPKPSP